MKVSDRCLQNNQNGCLILKTAGYGAQPNLNQKANGLSRKEKVKPQINYAQECNCNIQRVAK